MFDRGQCDYPESEPRFRIQAMITCLQCELGVRYHPERRSDDATFQPEDSFLHGVIQGQGGTCASLPVLYAAVGRRLGYPIMLAATRCHLFCRWDALPWGDCFNIEASGDGVSFFEDDHYRAGRFEMPPETIRACGYLESLSPREELASFLAERGACWMHEKVYGEAATAFAWANECDPRRGQHALMTAQAMRKWDEALRACIPSRLFPRLDLGLPAPFFRHMPRQIEREFIRMRVMQGLFDDPDYERRWWAPLRSKPFTRPPGLPECLRIDFNWNRPPRRLTQPTREEV